MPSPISSKLRFRRPELKTVIQATLLVAVLLSSLFLLLIYFRGWSLFFLHARGDAGSLPVVATILIKSGTSSEEITLPGNVKAWHEAIIYARTTGYIKKWYVDIGSSVKEGELLAEIEKPELAAQLRQAEADLATAIANNKLAQSTALRWVGLLKSDSVSKQETDEKVATARALEAVVNSSTANLDRLKELQSFTRVVAPFDGIITQRNVDIGSLINEGSSNVYIPLFSIVQADQLRVYVNIPQSYAANIKPGFSASISFAEHPGQNYQAKLLETAKAIDPQTRTLLAQFVLDNRAGELLPGSYAEVHLKVPLAKSIIRLPINTLLFRSEGLQVAILGEDNRVILKKITISRDFGDSVEVATGINVGEKVIINPSDSLRNGEEVRVQQKSGEKK